MAFLRGYLIYVDDECLLCGKTVKHNALARSGHAGIHVRAGDAIVRKLGDTTRYELTSQGAAKLNPPEREAPQ
jgi:hypothetical protein